MLVRLQPNSSASGSTNTVNPQVKAAWFNMYMTQAPATITHP
jgi:hypothetical protein